MCHRVRFIGVLDLAGAEEIVHAGEPRRLLTRCNRSGDLLRGPCAGAAACGGLLEDAVSLGVACCGCDLWDAVSAARPSRL